MVRRLTVSLLTLALAAATIAATRQSPAAWPDFQQFYRSALKQHAIVGSSVAVLRNGAILERMHDGLRDRSANLAVDNDTIFHWASITKTFTGIAIMRLRDEGRLKLDDPIVKYVPELRSISNPFGPVEQI